MSTEDQLIVAGAVLLALILYLVLTLLRSADSGRKSAQRAAKRSGKWVIVDGSNVMHWQNGQPNIATVRKVVDRLVAEGFTPGVMFDANAGYLLTGKYQHDRYLSNALRLPVDQVMVVPKGTPADPAILTAARDFGGRVVSNDRFRDWGDAFPEVRKPGHLIRGSFRSGALALHLNPKNTPKKSRKKRSA